MCLGIHEKPLTHPLPVHSSKPFFLENLSVQSILVLGYFPWVCTVICHDMWIILKGYTIHAQTHNNSHQIHDFLLFFLSWGRTTLALWNQELIETRPEPLVLFLGYSIDE